MSQDTIINYAGGSFSCPNEKEKVLEELKTSRFTAPENVTRITFRTDEFTSFCPKSGQPDFQEVILEYEPNGFCLESKALKLYFWFFRSRLSYCEQLADEILTDICKAIIPKKIKVQINQKIRGGISLSVLAEK